MICGCVIHPTCSLNWFFLFWLEKWTSLKPLLAENGRTLSNFPFCHPLCSNFSKKSRFLWIPLLKVKIRFSYDIPHIIANYFMHQKFLRITLVLSCIFWDVCYAVIPQLCWYLDGIGHLLRLCEDFYYHGNLRSRSIHNIEKSPDFILFIPERTSKPISLVGCFCLFYKQ